jgi:hypothetical protein
LWKQNYARWLGQYSHRKRFEKVEVTLGQMDDHRDEQHTQNRETLAAIKADLKWIKQAFLKLPNGS